jgi:hypothetical protein
MYREQVPVYGPPPGHLTQDPSAAFLLGPYDPYRWEYVHAADQVRYLPRVLSIK